MAHSRSLVIDDEWFNSPHGNKKINLSCTGLVQLVTRKQKEKLELHGPVQYNIVWYNIIINKCIYTHTT